MSVRTVLLRSMAFAALAGGGLAALQHGEVGVGPGRAATTPVVLTAGPAPDATQDLTAPDASVALSPLGLPCGLSVSAEAAPGAMVALDIIDPCAPDARVTITHNALSVTARTDAMGLLTVDLPALETPAFVTVHLDGGAEATVLTGLPDFGDHDRIALGWEGNLGLQLHAFEGDATFGASGHVWQDAPGDKAAGGGFLTMLGDATMDPPGMAQIYTVPRTRSGSLTVSVEVPITDANCGQPVNARILRVDPTGQVDVRPITMTLPGCDAVGEFLLLQNLFSDLRLASN